MGRLTHIDEIIKMHKTYITEVTTAINEAFDKSLLPDERLLKINTLHRLLVGLHLLRGPYGMNIRSIENDVLLTFSVKRVYFNEIAQPMDYQNIPGRPTHAPTMCKALREIPNFIVRPVHNYRFIKRESAE